MKKIISFILSVAMLLSITAGIDLSAYAEMRYYYYSGDFYFEYCLLDDGTAEITEYRGSETYLTIPENFYYDDFDNHYDYEVTSIGNEAFYGCTSLTSVTMGNNITSIGDRAFMRCSNLTSITLPNSITSIDSQTFWGCSSLKSIIIPDGVTKICSYAFDSCYSLTSITLPKSITSINKYAFDGCQQLKVVYFTGSESEWNNISGYKFGSRTIHYNVVDEHKYEFTATIEPTCLSEGYRLFKCKNCNDEKVKYISILEHEYKFVKTVEPTCYDEGYSIYACDYCGNNITKILTYSAHSFENGICKSCGILTSDFAESKHPYTNDLDQSWIINKPNAKYIAITFSSSTYTESGYDFIYIYDKNENLVGCYSGSGLASKRIVVSGDTIEIRLVSDNSTSKYGFALTNVQVYYNCNHSESELISKKEPNCTEQGYCLYKCSICGQEYKTDISNSFGHSWNIGSVTKSATCTATGVKIYSCTKCKVTKTETIAKIAHTYKTTTTKATTSKNGSIITKCRVCGKVSKDTTIYCPKTIALSATTYTYNGKVKKPGLIVKDSKGKTLKNGTDYTVSYASGRKNVGKYAVKITFKGNYSGSKTLYITINPKATTLSSVTAKSKRFTVKWKKQATQTTGYEIQYATDSKFTKNKKAVTVNKNSTISKTISKLSAKKKYYVRIRTYKTVKVNGKNTKIYSSWSKAKTVTTK